MTSELEQLKAERDQLRAQVAAAERQVWEMNDLIRGLIYVCGRAAPRSTWLKKAVAFEHAFARQDGALRKPSTKGE